MATARRRIIRPAASPPPSDDARHRQLQRLRTRLLKEQSAHDRWWRKLRRALNAVAKHHRALKGLERQIAQLGGTTNGPHC